MTTNGSNKIGVAMAMICFRCRANTFKQLFLGIVTDFLVLFALWLKYPLKLLKSAVKLQLVSCFHDDLEIKFDAIKCIISQPI